MKELIDVLEQCIDKINTLSQLQTDEEFHKTNDFLNHVLDVIDKHKNELNSLNSENELLKKALSEVRDDT